MPALWSILYYLRNDPEKLKWSQRKRGLDPGIVDRALELDAEWRRLKRALDEARHRLREASRKVASLSGGDREEALKEARRLREEVEVLERKMRAAKEERDRVLLSIPNVCLLYTSPSPRDRG